MWITITEAFAIEGYSRRRHMLEGIGSQIRVPRFLRHRTWAVYRRESSFGSRCRCQYQGLYSSDLAGECWACYTGENPSEGLPECTHQTAPSSMTMIFERIESASRHQSWCGVEEKLSDSCLFHLKPPGFKKPRQLLPSDLDSSLEECFKACVDSSSSSEPVCPPSSDMVPPEKSCQSCGVHDNMHCPL